MAPVQEAEQNTGSKNMNEDADDVLQTISMSEPLCAPLLLTCFGARDAPGAQCFLCKMPQRVLALRAPELEHRDDMMTFSILSLISTHVSKVTGLP